MLTAEQFLQNAKSMEVVINGVKFTAQPKEFSTGSVGWSLSTKLPLPAGEESLNCQIGLNMTVIGSKKNKD